jgi:hypothetical protein
MDEYSKQVLNLSGLHFEQLNEIEGQFIPRDELLSDLKYDEIKKLIPELKKKYSSSFMTSLQKNAEKVQKWPLLNIVRQILSRYGFKMIPIRKSDGYTLDGMKKYKRLFQIERKKVIVKEKEQEEEKQEKVSKEVKEEEEKLSEYILK